MKSAHKSFSLFRWLGLALLACPALVLAQQSSMTASPGSAGPIPKGPGSVPSVVVKARYSNFKVSEGKDYAMETRYNVTYTISFVLTDLQPARDEYPDGAIQYDDEGNQFYIGKILIRERVGSRAEHSIAQSGVRALGTHPQTDYAGTYTQTWTAYTRSDDPSLSKFHFQVLVKPSACGLRKCY